MAKQYYGCIRLTKHNPGWSDPINDIHLLRTHRTFKCVLEDYDLRPIMKGIKEGLIEFTRADIEGTADADDGARLPMYCGHCICQAHLIKEGVLADYQADVDYQSDLEWQPPQPAERPAPTPNVQITGLPAQIEAGQEVVFQVKLDQLKPEKVMVETGTDENGEPIMEEQEQHKTVTVSVSANGGEVSPTTLTFSSDPESPDYFMNAKEVKFTAPDESANVSIEISGDGVKAKTQSVKVQGDEPIPEEPEQPKKNPVIKINGSSNVIEIARGVDSFKGTISVDLGDCNEADINPMEFILTSKGGGAGCTVSGNIGDELTFTGLGTAPSNDECVIATISVSMTCLGGDHEITQEFQVKVPKLELKMFFQSASVFDINAAEQVHIQGLDYVIANCNKEIAPVAKFSIDGDPDAPGFMGNYYLIQPVGSNLKLKGYDQTGGTLVTEKPLPNVFINGIEYWIQYVDLTGGKGGVSIEVTE